MRVALSLLVCFISALLFSLSAKANYDAELKSYDGCKNTYKNGKCESVPFFSKKSVLEKFSACQLPADKAAELESTSGGANCTNVKSITKLCADIFQKTVVQESGSYCARPTQQQAAAAGKPGAGAPKPAVGGGTNGADVVALMGAVGAPLVAALDKRDKDKKAPPAQAAASNSSVKKDSSGTASVQNTGAVVKAAGNDPVNNEPAKEERLVQLGGEVDSNAQQGVEIKNDNNDLVQLGGPPDSPRETAAASKDATADMMASVTTAKQAMPDAAKVIENFANETKNAEKTADAFKGEVTSAAAQADEKLLAASKEVISVSSTLADEGSVPFSQTMAAFSAVNGLIETYVNSTKKSCTGNAERTGFLCMENTSPGMQNAKIVMDVAGPSLALINSAQKSCSTTAKITRLIGNGLMIAKGVCVGSKALCDMTCSTAVTQLKAIASAIQTKIPAAITADAASGAACTYCSAEIAAKVQASHTLLAKLMAPVANEITPSAGTSPGLVKKCESHMKDIALLGLNILGTMQAQKGAKACADKLKAGDGTTTADYCAQAANSVSSYCKCQKDNTQLGCSGHIVANTGSTTTNDGKSSDSRLNNGGVSGFAGPGVGGAKMDLGAVKSPIMTGTGIGGGNDPSLAKDAATAGKMGGAASAAGGGAGAAGGKNAELGGAEGTEKKKWSFGAFTSGFGGGSSGNGKGAADGTGRLGQKDLNAQRKIASEQFRAEVSEASGRSNWEKVRSSYVRKSSSLLGR